MDEEDDYNNDLMKAQEDEEGFDQLNSETFGDLGGCNDDWENEHELFADPDVKPDLLLLEFSNGFSSAVYPDYSTGDDVEDCMENDIGNQLSRLVTDDDDDVADKYSSGLLLSYNNKNGSYAKPYDMWNDSLDLSHTTMLSASPLMYDRSPDRPAPTKAHHLSYGVGDSSKKNGQVRSIPDGVGMTVEELEKILLTGGESGKRNLPEIPDQSALRLTSFPPPPIFPLPPTHRQMIPTSLLVGQNHLHPAQYLPAGSSVYSSDGSAVSKVSHIQAPPGFMYPQARDGQSPSLVGHHSLPRPIMQHPSQQPIVSTNCAYRGQMMMSQHPQMLPRPSQVLPQHMLRMMQNHPQMLPQHPPMLPHQQPQHLQAMPHRSQMLSPQHPHVISQASQMLPPHLGQSHLPLRPYQYMPPVQHRPQMLPQHGLLLQQQQHLFYHQQRHKQFQQGQQMLPSQLPLVVNKPLQQFPLHQQQMFQQRQMMAMAQHMGFPHPHQYGGQPYSHGGQRVLRPRGEEDPSEYDGLMEQREKDWLIKIQMMQLHTDNPYVDDFYYTCWSMKKIIKENRQLKKMETRRSNENGDTLPQVTSTDVSVDEDDNNNDNDDVEELEDGENVPSLLIPQSSKIENKRYEPAQYEGSLGKLTASSIRNPRQIIDVNLSSSAEDGKKHDTKKLKELLGKIEKAFDVLLEVDELEKKSSTKPLESRSKIQDEKQERITTLTQKLLCNQAALLQQFLSVRKGVLLVTRLLPLVVETNDVHKIICMILAKLEIILKKEWKDEVSLRIFHSSSNAIASSDLVQLGHFSVDIQRNCKGKVDSINMTQILQSQLGISVILLMANRAEKLLQDLSEDEDVQTAARIWASFLLSVSECFISIGDDSLAKPFKMSLAKKLKCQGFIGQGFVDSLKRIPLLLSDKNECTDGNGKLIDEVSCKMKKLLA